MSSPDSTSQSTTTNPESIEIIKPVGAHTGTGTIFNFSGWLLNGESISKLTQIMSIFSNSSVSFIDLSLLSVWNFYSLVIVSSNATIDFVKDLFFQSQQLGMQFTHSVFSPDMETDIQPESYVVTLFYPSKCIKANLLAGITEILTHEKFNIQKINNLGEMDSKRTVLEMTIQKISPSLFSISTLMKTLRSVCDQFNADIAFQSENILRRRKQMIVFDISNTLVSEDTTTGLGKYLNLSTQFSDIDSQFPEPSQLLDCISAKTKLLKGYSLKQINAYYDSLPFIAGTTFVCKVLQKLGYTIALISSSFFRSNLHKLGAKYIYTNQFETDSDNKLTGELLHPRIDGLIKMDILHFLVQKENISLQQVIAVGDGPHTAPLLSLCGLGIGFDDISAGQFQQLGKTRDLSSVLYLLGYPPFQFLSLKEFKTSIHNHDIPISDSPTPANTQEAMVLISGSDRPGIVSGITSLFSSDIEIVNIRQVVIHSHLTLIFHFRYPESSNNQIIKDLLFHLQPDPLLDVHYQLLNSQNMIYTSLNKISTTLSSSKSVPFTTISLNHDKRISHVVTIISSSLEFSSIVPILESIGQNKGQLIHSKILSRLKASKLSGSNTNNNQNLGSSPNTLIAETSLSKPNNNNIVRHRDHPALDCIELFISLSKQNEVSFQTAVMQLASDLNIDIALQSHKAYLHPKRLVVFDCDSTLIKGECINDIAEIRGVSQQVSAITQRAMDGDLDFEASLRQRVALLEGTPARGLIDELTSNLQYSDGAKFLCQALKSMGCTLVVISGGFNSFIYKIKSELGLDYGFANTLEVNNGKLTGKLLGPLVDGKKKADLLRLIASEENIDMDQTVAIGDGSNDILMLQAAGMGVAFNGKDILQKHAKQRLNSPSLGSLLYLFGFDEDSIRNMLA